jgi:hypothetical protein
VFWQPRRVVRCCGRDIRQGVDLPARTTRQPFMNGPFDALKPDRIKAARLSSIAHTTGGSGKTGTHVRRSASEKRVCDNSRDEDQNGRGKGHLAAERAIGCGLLRLPCRRSLVESERLIYCDRCRCSWWRRNGGRSVLMCPSRKGFGEG